MTEPLPLAEQESIVGMASRGFHVDLLGDAAALARRTHVTPVRDGSAATGRTIR